MSVTRILDRREELKPLWTLYDETWFTYANGLYKVNCSHRREDEDVKVQVITDRIIYQSTLPPKTLVCPVDVTIFHRPSQSKEQPFEE